MSEVKVEDLKVDAEALKEKDEDNKSEIEDVEENKSEDEDEDEDSSEEKKEEGASIIPHPSEIVESEDNEGSPFHLGKYIP